MIAVLMSYNKACKLLIKCQYRVKQSGIYVGLYSRNPLIFHQLSVENVLINGLLLINLLTVIMLQALL